jgi:hypothetical protein
MSASVALAATTSPYRHGCQHQSHDDDENGGGVTHKKVEKRVTFFHAVRCHMIDYGHGGEDGPHDTWYTEQDYSDFTRDVKFFIGRSIKDLQETIISCTRGVEHFIDPKICATKMAHRIAAWDNVLDAQEELWSPSTGQVRWAATLPSSNRGCRHQEDPSAVLAEAYREVSESCHRKAYVRGLQDQYEALLHHDEIKKGSDGSYDQLRPTLSPSAAALRCSWKKGAAATMAAARGEVRPLPDDSSSCSPTFARSA